jgi:Tfp pilus assembly protein PilF
LRWLGLIAAAGLGIAGPPQCVAQLNSPIPRQQPSYALGGKPTMGESFSSSIKRGVGKLTEMITPRPRVESDDDPVSLASKAKPGVELHVAVARLYVESGKLAEAAEHYQKALQREPHSLPALLGYAYLKDRMGEPAEAEKLYLQAVRAHPKEASAHNNLALFYAGQGMFHESVSALARAIQLQPNSPKYRNNIAEVLVRMGRMKEAFAHLSTVHRPAVAHYNLGYLLERQGQVQAAAQHFTIALQTDSSLAPARLALQRLQRTSPQPQPRDPLGLGTRVGNRPMRQAGGQDPFDAGQRPPGPPGMPSPEGTPGGDIRWPGTQPSDVAPLPPSTSGLLRLPPTSGEDAVTPATAPLPPKANSRQPTPAAPPLARPNEGPALRPLPRVD